MLKPMLFALTGAGITAAAYFSRSCPSTLAATQLTIYALVFGLKPIANAPAHVDQVQGYITVGTFLFLSKLFEYWTMTLAGPLTSQAAFFSLPLVFLCMSHAFPAVWNFELDRWEFGMQLFLIFLVPAFAILRPEPSGWGIATVFATVVASGIYSASYSIAMEKYTDRSVIEVRSFVYFSAAILAITVGLYSFERPENYLSFGLFVAACAAHAAVRKWYDANEGSKGSKIAGEWNALRAFLVLTWAWLFELQGVLVLYAFAIAIYAYYFKSERQRQNAMTKTAPKNDSIIPLVVEREEEEEEDS